VRRSVMGHMVLLRGHVGLALEFGSSSLGLRMRIPGSDLRR